MSPQNVKISVSVSEKKDGDGNGDGNGEVFAKFCKVYHIVVHST
jgi:hypothetical protein